MVGRSRGVAAMGKAVSAPVGKGEGGGEEDEQQEIQRHPPVCWSCIK